jgi:glycosyltransferase involved in cell wall biosynthesis
MKASIIIRAYNAQSTIERAINSALSQGFAKNQYEIVIINDGSTDETLKLINNYRKEKNIRIYSQYNKGGIVAANRGFQISEGEYVILLDSDDYFEKNILKELTQTLDKNQNVEFAYPDYFEKTDNKTKRISPKNVFETLSVGTMFRKAKLKAEGYFKRGVTFAEYDLMLRTLDKWKGIHVEKTLFTYMRRKGSSTSNREFVEKGIDELKKLHPSKLKYILQIRDY